MHKIKSMERISSRAAAALAVVPLLLAACSPSPDAPRPRVELPQQLRLPPADESLLTIFERRVGKIAIMDEDGSLRVTDQLGRENNVLPPIRERRGGATSRYVALAWSPDASQIAVVQRTRNESAASAILELNPSAVTIQRGSRSVTLQGSSQDDLQPTQDGQSTYTERNPELVIIQRGASIESLISSAVYVAPLDTSLPVREVFHSAYEEVEMVEWSPNGKLLAVMTRDLAEERVRLYLVEPRDDARPQLIFQGADVSWHWHPSGDVLLMRQVVASLQPDRLVRYDVWRGISTTLPLRAGDIRFTSPALSPEGDRVLLTTRVPSDNQRHQLILADAEGNTLTKLTEFTGQIYFSWSPKGNQIAYVVRDANDGPGGLLQVMDLPDGKPRVISGHAVEAFFWSPDGERIAALSAIAPDEVNPNFLGYDLTPARANATVYLLETINPADGSARELFYFVPTNAFRQFIQNFDRYARSATIWAPDGRKLVFPIAFESSQMGAANLVIETESSGSLVPRLLGTGSMALWSPK